MHKCFRYLFLFSLFSLVNFTVAGQKPNILLILVDDMGYSDLGCMGSEIKTPNIDSLAAAGITFANFSNNCSNHRTKRII